ncbi:hypothetical protein ACJ73_01917 [Blastomyces percursus]|uniref:Aminoglycoside phosphotransferase domain-containing protein n=1 Tax=Blastomyces percursus TaxID=1658174 RepID=A0A1J9RGD9_9EURO|nr:hypothetical protein ACJ73_01917 [Blastomyces percursus]
MVSATANKSPAQGATSVDEDSKLHDGDLLKGYSHLNQSLVAELQSKLAKKEWADLTQVVTKWGRRYPSKRRQLENLCSKKGSSEHHGNAMAAAISRRRAEIFSVSPDEPIIHRPLAPEVKLLLGGGQESLLISAGLSQALLKGKVLWERFLLAVIQLSEQVVVKTGIDLPLSDFDVIDHIWKVSHDIPAPRPLGAMSIGKRTYIFMSFVEGATLDTQWDILSNEEKRSIRDQLDAIMEKLRSLPLPSRYLGIGSPPRCVDTRMWTRTSPEYIENEGQFNAFLLGNPDPLKTEPYVEFVRSMLREDHRIVLTHGDLHPRNIMVRRAQHGGLIIAGIIDWEMGGAYPEYWEYLKALNTMFPLRRGDWFFFLPLEGIGKYTAELAIDNYIQKLL